MATVNERKLVLGFGTNAGKTKSISIGYVLSTPDSDDIIAAMDLIVANGEVFNSVPVSKKSAQLITTTKVDYPVEAE